MQISSSIFDGLYSSSKLSICTVSGAELGFSDRGCKILATNYLPCYYPYPEPILEQCKAVRYRYSIFIVKNLALFIIKLFFSKICPSSFISWNARTIKPQRTNPELSVFKSKPRVQMIVFLKNRGCNAPAAPALTPPLYIHSILSRLNLIIDINKQDLC